MNKLIAIKTKPLNPDAWRNPDHQPMLHLTSTRPFVENNRAALIHRVERMSQYKLGDRRPHLCVKMWCGQGQNGLEKFTFHDDPPHGKLVCQRCETAAVEAGLPTADELAGRHVCLGKVKAVRTCVHPLPEPPEAP
jgi:hypothetical protein